MEGIRARRRQQLTTLNAPNKRIEKRYEGYIYVKRKYVGIVLCLLLIQLVFVITKIFDFRGTRVEHAVVSQHETNQDAADILVTIYAYDRPRHLMHLLRDIDRESEKTDMRIGVNIIDDNSMGCFSQSAASNIFDTDNFVQEDHSFLDVMQAFPSSDSFARTAPCSARARFRFIESFARQRGWRLFVSKYRHGRRRYWHLVRMAHSLLRNSGAKYFFFLPDDDRLASDFFIKVLTAWHSIDDHRKRTLMLHIEETREHVAVWTNLKPRLIRAGIWRIGWVESGNFMCDNRMLAMLNWSFPRVPVQRWIDNPPISSGVGATLSELIHSSGMRMYRTQQSFVAHVGVTASKMNSQFRTAGRRVLVTKYFADGNDAYEQHLRKAATVAASMASVWLREPSLHAVIDSLAHQVDHLNVYLNGYDTVPAFLLQPHITVVQGSKDVGDIGKFYWHNELKTDFHATVDDDIVYPSDYITKLMEFRQAFIRPVIVGVHGIRIIKERLAPQHPDAVGVGYYGARKVFMAIEHLEHRKIVHILGTGTVLYKVDDVGTLDINSVFKQKNMADIWLGGWAQQRKIPMVVMPHNASWIQEVSGTFDQSIYVQSTMQRSSDRNQTEAAKSFMPWVLNYP